MADVRPFRGLRCNPAIVGDVGRVLSPPYDIISPQEQEELYRRSPFNVVRLELGRSRPDDTETSNAYNRALALLVGWQNSRALVREGEPAFYLLREEYGDEDAKLQRLALFAAVRLEKFEQRVVLPHEATRPGPKEDRLRLMQASRANFSPLLALYREPGGLHSLLLRQMEAGPPDLATDRYSTRCRVWILRDPQLLEEIQRSLQPLPLYLADGHHRYETAITYRDMQRDERAGGETQQGDPAYDFVLMCLEELFDPGLQLLSFHRLLQGLSSDQVGALWRRIREVFEVESVPTEGLAEPAPEIWLRDMESQRERPPTLGLVDVLEGRLYTLRLRPDLPPGTLPHPSVPELLSCDTWLLHQGVLDPVLGANSDRVSFVHDLGELSHQGNGGGPQLAFLLRPMALDLFEKVVRQGERLPPKTTYFFPKLPTGLVMHLLHGEL